LRRVYSVSDAPTLRRFHADDSFVRCVMGSIGSGKSVACVNELIRRARHQEPNPEGLRKSRWAVIRNSYPELLSTTIKTWQEWLPPSVCPIVFGAPIVGRLQQPVGDGTTMDMEVFFIALNLPKDVKKLLSLELTGAWINEAREVDKSIVDAVTGRVGRYPAKIDGAPITWSGLVMDTNPPDEMHWWYKLAEETDSLKGWRFFRQPPALLDAGGGHYRINPQAENVRHQQLGAEYWLRQVEGKTREWIKVYLQGEYGTISSGKPIYESHWLDSAHVAEVELLNNVELFAGWDWGLSPACCIVQMTASGRLEVLDEIVGDNIGAAQFAEMQVLPLLAAKYAGRKIEHIGDPAGAQRAQTDERTVFDELRRLGIRVRPAPTQDPLARWEAVRWFLGQLVGGRPRFALSPRCKMLRKGFNGGYHFRRMQVGGDEKYSEKAEKNMFSHVHDSLSYACCHIRQPYIRPKDNSRPIERYRPIDAVAGY